MIKSQCRRVLTSSASSIASAVIATLAVVGVAHADAPVVEDANDVAFIATLEAFGVPVSSHAAAITAGRDVCDALHSGDTFDQVAGFALGAGFTAGQSGDIVGAAVSAYCPDEAAAMESWASRNDS